MKKKHPEHVNLERWLVSYADFITLLFAFFVVMWAISQTDIAKLKAVQESIRDAFGASGPALMLDVGGKSGGQTVAPFDNVMTPGGRVMNMPAGKTHTSADEDPELQTLKEKLEETISMELGVSSLSQETRLVYDSQGLLVRIAAKDFFDPDGVVVNRDLLPLLDRIGRVLSSSPRLIRIEGHTDSQEENGWELSSRRAAWVAEYWIRRFRMKPQNVGIAGYSHYRPVSEGGTAWSRGANRRIEIMVLNNQYEQDKKSRRSTENQR